MRKAAKHTYPEATDKRQDALLWVGILLSLFAAGINTVVGYSVAHWVCQTNHKGMGFLVSIVDMCLCIVALVITLSVYRQSNGSDESAPAVGRRNFMAITGILLAAFAMLVVAAGTIALISLHPCD
jgi:ABC-type sulfate transport system permease subunit